MMLSCRMDAAVSRSKAQRTEKAYIDSNFCLIISQAVACRPADADVK